MTDEGAKKVVAKNRSVAIGGSAHGSVIITGDDARVGEGASIGEFLALLKELRQEIRDAPLAATVAEDLDGEAEGVERQARREKPNGTMILGKIKTIVDVLTGAAGVGEKLVPMARRLGEMAGQLF